MRAKEFIIESQGGIFRRAQEVSQGTEVRFKNAQNNDEISLVSATMVPEQGAYATEEEIDQGLQAYLKPILGPNFAQFTQFTGNPAKARAALVSIWKEVPPEGEANKNKPEQLRELIVVKKNGRKSTFDREKLAKSINIALRKRPVDSDTIEKFISKIYRNLEDLGQAEILSSTIGKYVMEGLKELDPVAYVRFASVYTNFKEAKDFEQFVDQLNVPSKK